MSHRGSDPIHFALDLLQSDAGFHSGGDIIPASVAIVVVNRYIIESPKIDASIKKHLIVE